MGRYIYRGEHQYEQEEQRKSRDKRIHPNAEKNRDGMQVVLIRSQRKAKMGISR